MHARHTWYCEGLRVACYFILFWTRDFQILCQLVFHLFDSHESIVQYKFGPTNLHGWKNNYGKVG